MQRLLASALQILFLLLGAALASSVQAVTVSPVLIELSPAQRVASVTITNTSDQPMNFQAETLTWSQAGGTDHYEETEDLMVAPPIAEIPPQSSQIFRVTLRRQLSGTVEQAYRLMLEDVSEVLSVKPGVIALRFNHNLPVFAIPAGEPQLAPRWSRCAAVTGKACVRVDNEGNRHISLSELTVAGNGWEQKIQGGTVLAGAWKQWIFDLPSARGLPARITAKTDQGELSAELPAH